MCALELFLCRQMPSVCITWQETNCAARSQVTPCAVLFSSPFFSFFHSGPYFIAPFGEERQVFICQVPYCLSLGRGEAKIRYIRFWMGKLWFLEYIQSPWKLLGKKSRGVSSMHYFASDFKSISKLEVHLNYFKCPSNYTQRGEVK